MRINVIGGGPAGLYIALLMKKREASHEITVFERNAPDSTFGWGVVFSGKTLSNLRAADEESHRSITESFETWTTRVIRATTRVRFAAILFMTRAPPLLNIFMSEAPGWG